MSEERDMADAVILVDADACPVKDEIYEIAFRTGVPAHFVTNSGFRIPRHALISIELVSDAFDAADDAIAERADGKCVIVTSDILLAERCVKAGATVLSPTGKAFDAHNIGTAVATRAIMADLRAGVPADGPQNRGGPAPFNNADRSRFRSALDAALVALTSER